MASFANKPLEAHKGPTSYQLTPNLVSAIILIKMDKEPLILEVENNAALYDKTHTMFEDSHKKKDIWDAIGERLGVSGKSRYFIKTVYI